MASLSPRSQSKRERVNLTSGIRGATAHSSGEWSTPLYIWQGTIFSPPWTVWAVWSEGSRIFHLEVLPELFWRNTESKVSHPMPLNFWDSRMINLMYKFELACLSGWMYCICVSLFALRVSLFALPCLQYLRFEPSQLDCLSSSVGRALDW